MNTCTACLDRAMDAALDNYIDHIGIRIPRTPEGWNMSRDLTPAEWAEVAEWAAALMEWAPAENDWHGQHTAPEPTPELAPSILPDIPYIDPVTGRTHSCRELHSVTVTCRDCGPDELAAHERYMEHLRKTAPMTYYTLMSGL